MYGNMMNHVTFVTVFQESKRAFLHNIVNEEGEKGKLECFVNFCEDTIFEARSVADNSATFAYSVIKYFNPLTLTAAIRAQSILCQIGLSVCM